MSELYHVGLTVSDIDKSYTFYHDVIGMSDDFDYNAYSSHGTLETGSSGVRYFTVKSDEFDKLTSTSGSVHRTSFLRDSSGFLLQLVQYVHGGDAPLELHHNRPGSVHFCFYFDDIIAKRREVEERGDVKLLSELIQITPTKLSFYAGDPDGVFVELLQSATKTADGANVKLRR
jgi:catechol 2,3-dioxygenase-like lactoylglutathione lyase family enzyme